MLIPPQKQKTLDLIIADLQQVSNVSAIVLGGSYATGRANAESDIDLGIYYHESHPFAIEDMQKIAQKYDIQQNPTVTDFYQWGPWVNGGAWIHTESGKVDFLYRNINQVRRTIQESVEGKWENHFEQQPPYGFSSIFYLAEIEACIPIYDPQNMMSYLKSLIKIYPEPLKNTITQDSLWSAEFTILNTSEYIEKNDFYNAYGCITRAIKAMVQALFALNETYPIGDKNALEILEKAKLSPKKLKEKVNEILKTKHTLAQNFNLLKSLFQEIVILSDGKYKPLYNYK
ncbi:Nucleotidyltransferase domain [Sphingobacterium daejeonense]|nr:Nucleotidyltransferase domain [Sphingobacterium daejeonense]